MQKEKESKKNAEDVENEIMDWFEKKGIRSGNPNSVFQDKGEEKVTLDLNFLNKKIEEKKKKKEEGLSK